MFSSSKFDIIILSPLYRNNNLFGYKTFKQFFRIFIDLAVSGLSSSTRVFIVQCGSWPPDVAFRLSAVWHMGS